MRRWQRLLAATTLAAAMTAGCKSSSPTSVALEDFQAQFVGALCASAVNCGAYPDQATCLGASTSAAIDPLVADVSAGTVRYDGQAALECLSAMEYRANLCGLGVKGRIRLPQACSTMFVGTVAAGGACLHDQECVSGACDRSACADACCAGACAAAARPAGTTPLGAACGSNDECVAGAFCPWDRPAPVCTALLASDQPCASDDQCVLETACISTPSSKGAVVCATPPQIGQACAGPGVCVSPMNFCDLASHTCVPRLAVGAACDPAADGCVAYASCDANGRCVARGVAGAACAPPPAVDTCLGELVCIGGTCALPAPQTCPPG